MDDEATSMIKVNGKAFNDMKSGADTDYYLDMHVPSGYMTQTKKVSTFFIAVNNSTLAFPSIKANAMVPLYDYHEEMKVGEHQFQSKFTNI